MKPISYEEACKIPRLISDIDMKTMPIYKEASEQGNCKLMRDDNSSPPSIDIFVELPDIGHDSPGILISPNEKDISVYVAREYHGEILSWLNVGYYSVEDNLSTIIAKAQNDLNTCPECKKPTPFSEQSGFSFAGRCCKDCLPTMKKEYEYPGWYN